MEYVETNVGLIPIEDFYEIKAVQAGFDSYESMKKEGFYIEKPNTIFK